MDGAGLRTATASVLAQVLGTDATALSTEDLTIKLNALSAPQMAAIFNRVLPLSGLTQTSFCKQAQINQGNFSRWMRNLKRSPTSFFAVRDWLLAIMAYRILPPPKPSSEQRPVTRDGLTLPMLLHDLRQRSSGSPPAVRNIVVIDSDNLSDLLSVNMELCKLAAAAGMHFVAVLRRGGQNRHITPGLSHVSIMFAKAAVPNGADVRCATTLMALASCMPQGTTFALATMDNIAREIVADVAELAPCVWLESEAAFVNHLKLFCHDKNNSLSSHPTDEPPAKMMHHPLKDRPPIECVAFNASPRGSTQEIEEMPRLYTLKIQD